MFRNGCGAQVTVFVPRGYDFKEVKVRCGSTAYDGGVNQCDACAEEKPMPPAREDESDLDYFERTEGGDL